MLTDMNIEKRCRYRLARHNLRVHKLSGDGGPVYYAYEIGEDGPPPDNVTGRYMSLWKLLDFAERLAEKEAEYRASKGKPWPSQKP